MHNSGQQKVVSFGDLKKLKEAIKLGITLAKKKDDKDLLEDAKSITDGIFKKKMELAEQNPTRLPSRKPFRGGRRNFNRNRYSKRYFGNNNNGDNRPPEGKGRVSEDEIKERLKGKYHTTVDKQKSEKSSVV